MTSSRRAYHPLLLAFFPVLTLYARNLATVEVADILPSLALTLGVTLTLWLGLRLARMNQQSAAWVVSSAFILFFSFGPAVRVVGKLLHASRESWVEPVFFLAEALLLVVSLIVLRWPRWVELLTRFLNPASLALLLMAVISTVMGLVARSGSHSPAVTQRPTPVLKAQDAPLPDVYFIVLDAYGRSDVLRNVVGVDNSLFVKNLVDRGFLIPEKSRASYVQTALSLASTLNLTYLDDLSGNPSDDRLPLRRLIRNAPLIQGFRNLGYRVVRFDSGFDATESVMSDLNLGPPESIGTFSSLVADQTPLWLLLGSSASHDPRALHRRRILQVFDQIATASHPSDRPTFTFAHVLAPHPPFLFGPNGEDRSDLQGPYTLNDNRDPGEEGSKQYAAHYADQVRFLNRQVEQAVDRILSTSRVEPIIVIQGDHGPGTRFNADDPQPNDLGERLPVLNAVYLPRKYRQPIEPAITLVNTWRLLLDRCFDARTTPLPNRSFYSPYPHPYVFIDVTNRVENP